MSGSDEQSDWLVDPERTLAEAQRNSRDDRKRLLEATARLLPALDSGNLEAVVAATETLVKVHECLGRVNLHLIEVAKLAAKSSSRDQESTWRETVYGDLERTS